MNQDQEQQQPKELVDNSPTTIAETRKSSEESIDYDDIKYVAQEGRAVRLDENGIPVLEYNKADEDRLRRKVTNNFFLIFCSRYLIYGEYRLIFILFQ